MFVSVVGISGTVVSVERATVGGISASAKISSPESGLEGEKDNIIDIKHSK